VSVCVSSLSLLGNGIVVRKYFDGRKIDLEILKDSLVASAYEYEKCTVNL
jgi:hypothetical protein